jgi:hypothetical protein
MKKFFVHHFLFISLTLLLSQSLNAGPLSISEPKYGSLEIKDAGITIEFPQNWFRQGKDTKWSMPKNGLPLVGFKWTDMNSDWKEENMLPAKSDFLGPFVINLGWKQGSLYLVQVKAGKERYEIHTVIPRLEAEIAYDFYARADSLAQLMEINFVIQRIMHSGELHRIKDYVSEDPEECEEITWDCGFNEEEFFDEKGCGCLIVPQEEASFNN